MLRVLGSVSAGEFWIQMDEYVPLRLRCSNMPDIPIYWRTGNFDTSLLEIGLASETGTICAVTVTSIDPSSFMLVANAARAARRIHGMPICDIGDWPSDRFKDEPNPFTVEVGADNIAVWLGSETALSALYESTAITFGVNAANEMCYLLFEGISRYNIDQLCQLVERTRQ